MISDALKAEVGAQNVCGRECTLIELAQESDFIESVISVKHGK